MKIVLYWCWEQLKKPLIQLIIVLVLLGGYWTWDIKYASHGEETATEAVEDTYRMDEMQPTAPTYTYVLPDSTIGDSTLVVVPEWVLNEFNRNMSIETDASLDEMSDREYRMKFWDMVLGHMGSILGSIAALGVPLYNKLKSKKENGN